MQNFQTAAFRDPAGALEPSVMLQAISLCTGVGILLKIKRIANFYIEWFTWESSEKLQGSGSHEMGWMA